MAVRTLYDLCGKDDRLRFSPYCWRAKLALKHKGLPFDTIPWHFTEKEALAFSGQGPEPERKVPVLTDEDGTTVTDSFEIMRYLDRSYPDKPLLGNEMAQERARFIKYWSEAQLAPAIMKIAILDIFALLAPEDRDYFRETREKRFGTTLESFKNPEQGRQMLASALAPLRARLSEAPYIDGDAPGGADYLAFGFFMMPYTVLSEDLFEANDVVGQWQARLLDAFGGYAREATRVGDISK
ncbi:glutathione S-transferase family protein [Phytohalomonas tamaricis]|uniref:glutathione S-transferase family protein n=1 Tax=Phytohalomonas tamaricis TaxID=2081032 RepID=UPI000D0BD8D7|nr:glutathione S-transferase family protein [Phytohalomonas tamaricis]